MSASRVVMAAVLAGSIGSSAGAGDGPAKKPAGELPEIKGLPDPFAFADGSPVRTRDDWGRRRAELKALFESYEYGHLPPRPDTMTVARGEARDDPEAAAIRQDLDVALGRAGKTLTLHVSLALPRAPKGPVPVVIQAGFGRPPAGAAAPAAKAKAKFAPRPDRLRPYTDRGYAVAELNYQELAPDNRDRARSGGIYQLFGDGIDCGGLMAWAWGMHRVVDALEGDGRIDAKKVVVTGHSRYGKASLIAGAFDERIALTVPSHSGCAGTAPYRFIYGRSEQLQNIVGAFPYWFRPGFDEFVGKVDRLPIDQHELKALVAPRALLDTEGTNDAWTNPEGAQLTHVAAAEVYGFLGARDRIAVRFRPVGHVPSTEDLLDFADHVFAGRPLPEGFGALPYAREKAGFDWSAPR